MQSISVIVKSGFSAKLPDQFIGAFWPPLHQCNHPVYFQEVFLTQNIILIIGSNSGL